ncbi:MAG: hypothetical protein U0414_11615 [Polyangiaceae bacterium]
MSSSQAALEDLERLLAAEAPTFVDALIAFAERAYEEYEDDEATAHRRPLPPEAISLAELERTLVAARGSTNRTVRRIRAKELWERYFAQPPEWIAPELRSAELIERLYAESDSRPFARVALLDVIARAPLELGVFGGLKRVFKRAERALDLQVYGALAARFDEAANHSARGVSRATLVYLRRRAWRVLREIGRHTPELYPALAVEILRSYGEGTYFRGLWIANHVFAHGSKQYSSTAFSIHDGATQLKHRAFADAWKRSPDPLMLLLETCRADDAARFAIASLKKDFPDALRRVTPAWLGGLSARKLPSAHDFMIEALEASPELHQGKLRSLGLHEPVLRLLASPSKKARAYAIEYARAHAKDLPLERLVALLGSDHPDVCGFAAAQLTARAPRDLGKRVVASLLKFDETKKWADKALNESFDRSELDEDFLAALLLEDDWASNQWAQQYIGKKLKPRELPVTFWIRLFTEQRVTSNSRKFVLAQLQSYPAQDLPPAWLADALAKRELLRALAAWIPKWEQLPQGFDLERLKGLVFDPVLRENVFAILAKTKLVSPGDVGLGWLLALAKRADPQLHEWAHRYLLMNMRPEHFAPGSSGTAGDKDAGIARLFELAMGPRESEAVRTFAQTYLRCHHPKLGKDQPETKQYGIKPGVPRAAYTEARVWPALGDARSDVRRFGVDVTRAELRRWNAQQKIYALGESPAKEVRNLVFEALLGAGDPKADPDFVLTPEELDAASIFSMTESRRRATRDVGMELIRAHYARIGGADRLGWLMQSADREVRLFAVKLLWEKHRPRRTPPGWAPKTKNVESALVEGGDTFADAEGLRALLRRLLFMLPGVRSSEAREAATGRRLSSSVAKGYVIEVVTELGTRDRAFAEVVAPVLGEFTGSASKMEWEACLSALMRLRATHGSALVEGLVGEAARAEGAR